MLNALADLNEFAWSWVHTVYAFLAEKHRRS